METKVIIFRVILSLVLSTIIGFERERNKSNAGIRTHAIVGISATIIALIQMSIVFDTLELSINNPLSPDVVRSDPARLIAQVVSGVGFLGAGTIIVTKRNISGLTTAASIWFVASLGLAIGMGYYTIAISGFIAVFSILLVTKHLLRIPVPRRLIIKFIGSEETQDDIHDIFSELNLDEKVIKFDMEMFHDQKIYLTTYETNIIDDKGFDTLIDNLSRHDQIISVQLTNI